MWPSILFLFIFCLFLLPLLPGMLELRLASDAKPLKVIQEYDTEITYFATGFKHYLEKNFPNFFSGRNKSTTPFQLGTLPDHTDFQIIHNGEQPVFDKKETSHSHTNRLIIAEPPLARPGKMLFEKEIYSAGAITTDENSQFRALLAEGNITLGQDCTILRWIHSGDSLAVGKGCSLYGRASAEKIISLSEPCQFERIHAPKILFGHSERSNGGARETSDLSPLEKLANVEDKYRDRWLVEGDIKIPDAHSFEGDLIASKNITLGADAYVKGSLKSNKDLILGKNARVAGAMVSAGNIHIAEGCHIAGPVIAEGEVFIESGSVLGLEHSPTTVSAPVITIISGVTVYGTVWAEDRAQMLAGGNVV